MNRPTMLILSFSPIAADARVLKQVQEFTKDHDVVTCGYGDAPDGVTEHIRLWGDPPVDPPNGRLITLRQRRIAFWMLPGVRAARAALRGRRFDVAIANDVEAVAVASELEPRAGVLADLHEYSPRLHEEHAPWMRHIAPYVRLLVRRYVRRAQAWTTVGEGIAAEFEREFGFRPEVVTNAAPFREGEPRPVGTPLRLVHSGAGLRNRRLEETITAVAEVPGATLDLYLTRNHPDYIAELRELAARAEGRVRVLDPVPYRELTERLADYDVGVFLLPPENFSYLWALPNKLFDYVQARLGVVVGPSPEMARLVQEHGLGVVAEGFDAQDLAEALRSLTAADVEAYKRAAHAAARELSAERQVAVWRRIIDRMEGRT